MLNLYSAQHCPPITKKNPNELTNNYILHTRDLVYNIYLVAHLPGDTEGGVRSLVDVLAGAQLQELVAIPFTQVGEVEYLNKRGYV